MKCILLSSIIVITILIGPLSAEEKPAGLGETRPAFNGVDYFHRWSLKD